MNFNPLFPFSSEDMNTHIHTNFLITPLTLKLHFVTIFTYCKTKPYKNSEKGHAIHMCINV